MAPKKHNNISEDQELEEAFHKMTGGNANSKNKTHHNPGIKVAICIALMSIIVCACALLFYLIHKDMNRIIVGDISIAGIHLQGMTQAEAITAVKAGYKANGITVTVLEHSIQIPADCVQSLKTRKAVRAACDTGMTAGAQALDLTPYLNVDEDQIRNCLTVLGNHYNTTLRESTYQILGQGPNQVLRVTLGSPEYGLDMEKLYQDVITAFGKGQSTLEGQFTLLEPKPVDLEAILSAHACAPVDAYYDKIAHKVVGGDDGYGFDLEAARTALDSADYGTTVEIPFFVISPAVTQEEATAALFLDTLGTFTAKSSSKSNRDTNLRLACEAINGITLYPGDSFSYNETLGERTPEKGYRPAGTYIGNETVNTYGGGICQVSSSLYYCVLLAELTVTERTNHGFLPSYMPRGLDATVNWGTLDFQFTNNLDYPVRIEAAAKGGTTTVTLFGTETRNYRVELGAKVISKTAYETEYQVMEPNNKEDYKDGDRIVSPHTGYYVKSYLYKYEKDSDKLISKEYIDDSTYRVRNAVVCKIEASTDDETKPEETVPEGSDSSTTPSESTPEDTSSQPEA